MRLLLLSLIACEQDASKPTTNDSAAEAPDPSPDILVEPTALSFVATLGGAPDVQSVTVTNTGLATLEIVGFGFDSPATSDVFSVTTIGALSAGASADLTLTFTPTMPGPVTGELSILSNDPETSEVVVALNGEVGSPELQLDPTLSELEATWVGCTELEAITLTNVGTADLVVTGLEYATVGTDFTFDAEEAVNGPLPWTLAPTESREVIFAYAPLDDIDDQATLEVSSNDPLRPEATAAQRGSATYYGSNVDTFDLYTLDALDVLFIVDNSAGMTRWEPGVLTAAAPLLEALGAVDYQIAVITTDSPTFIAEVITPSTADPVAALEAALAVGSGGSGNEMPVEMAYQSTQSGGDGAEFLRSEAGLAFIFVSDEPDSSPSDWGTYLSAFQDLKTRPEDFIAHAISGDWPTGCATASATNNAYELTVVTDGLYLSICEPTWDDHMDAIVEQTAAHEEGFELSERPVDETIEVWVDGVLLESGWLYSAADNAMEFEEGVLPEVGTVEVRYATYGECPD